MVQQFILLGASSASKLDLNFETVSTGWSEKSKWENAQLINGIKSCMWIKSLNVIKLALNKKQGKGGLGSSLPVTGKIWGFGYDYYRCNLSKIVDILFIL